MSPPARLTRPVLSHPTPLRPMVDRCPSLQRPFSAEDGALIRLRVPGGRISVARLAALLEVSERHGAGFVHLTSRGNLQLRALPDPLPNEVVAAVAATGLVPSSSHERARNILAAPLAANLTRLVNALDETLCADPYLADLPGRFLFALSDAGGSVLSEPWDLAYQQHDDEHGMLYAAGYGMPAEPSRAVDALLERARRFLQTRATSRIWNVRELPPQSPVFAGMAPAAPSVAPPLAPGVYPPTPSIVAAVPHGQLRRRHLETLVNRVGARDVAVTPWRSLVIAATSPSAAAQHVVELAASGFLVGSAVTTPTDQEGRICP